VRLAVDDGFRVGAHTPWQWPAERVSKWPSTMTPVSVPRPRGNGRLSGCEDCHGRWLCGSVGTGIGIVVAILLLAGDLSTSSFETLTPPSSLSSSSPSSKFSLSSLRPSASYALESFALSLFPMPSSPSSVAMAATAPSPPPTWCHHCCGPSRDRQGPDLATKAVLINAALRIS
jgi:hypothetical protein